MIYYRQERFLGENVFFVNSNPYGGIIRIRFEGIISAYNEAPLFCLFRLQR